MSKSKIDLDAIKEIENDFEGAARLKPNKKAGRPKKAAADVEEMLNIYNVPRAWLEIIKAHQVPFSVYTKMALESKLKADGWLKD
jgi:hypothetical protein